MERRFGQDFGEVRIHTGADAEASADRLNADAYTAGQHIYFGAGRYQPGTNEGRELLAHELTHTIQQANGEQPDRGLAMQAGDVTVGHPHDPLESEAQTAATTVMRGDATPSVAGSDQRPAVRRSVLGKIGGAIGSAWDATGGRLVGWVEDKIEDTIEWVSGWIKRHLGPLVDFLRDPVGFLKEKIEAAFDATVGAIISGVRDNSFFKGIAHLASEGMAMLGSALASIAADPCGAMRLLIKSVLDFETWMASGTWSVIKSGASWIADKFMWVYAHLLKPAWDAIHGLAGSAWDWITKRAAEFWSMLKPLRDFSSWIWRKAKSLLGIAWDGGGDAIDWLKDKAKAAWDRIYSVIQPVIGPLKVIGGVLLILSPLGPLVAIGAAAYGLYEVGKWIHEHWSDTIVVKARQILHDHIIPTVQGAVAKVSAALHAAGAWLSDQVSKIRTALSQLADAIGDTAVFKVARSVVLWVRDRFVEFGSWVSGIWTRVVDTVGPVLQKVWKFLQPILVVLGKLIIAIANPLIWPIYFGAVIWLITPDCLKPPIIDYLLDLMIGAIRAVPNFGLFGEEWPEIKERIAHGLEQKRKASVEEKIRFTNKVANMIAGPDLTGFSDLFEAARQSPDYFIGQVEEELVGMDPASRSTEQRRRQAKARWPTRPPRRSAPARSTPATPRCCRSRRSPTATWWPRPYWSSRGCRTSSSSRSTSDRTARSRSRKTRTRRSRTRRCVRSSRPARPGRTDRAAVRPRAAGHSGHRRTCRSKTRSVGWSGNNRRRPAMRRRSRSRKPPADDRAGSRRRRRCRCCRRSRRASAGSTCGSR